MGKKGSIYERELKGILSGDLSTIEKFSRSLNEKEYYWYRSLISKPFMVVRAAGSLGVDLIAIREDFSFPIEVKSSSMPRINFTHGSSRAQEQAKHLMEECKRTGVVALYAFRLKNYRGDPWRIFALPLEGIRGRMRYVYNVLPKISYTPQGNFVLLWEKGMPLSKFISYLNLESDEDDVED